MTALGELETTLGGWYKSAPHLPKNGQKWLADNLWWLALIGAVLSILGLLVVIPAFFATLAVTSYVTGGVSTYYSSTYYNSLGGLYWLSLLVSLVSYIVTTILLALAVNPLKAKSKKGWEFLFWSYLANFAFSVVSAIVIVNIPGVIGSIIGVAVGGYFLFEVRSYFGAKHKVSAKPETKAKA